VQYELKTQLVGLHYNNAILSCNLVVPISKGFMVILLDIYNFELLNEFVISFGIIEFTIKENVKKRCKMINLQ
jgi:hypothetical protein